MIWLGVDLRLDPCAPTYASKTCCAGSASPRKSKLENKESKSEARAFLPGERHGPV